MKIALGERPVLGGYPGHRRAELPGEPVYARALAVEAGGAQAFIANIDTVLIPGELEEEVLRRANLGPQTCLLLAATHTHSGPGGAWDNLLAGWAGAGAFDREQRDAIAQAAAEALTTAGKSIRPAQLRAARKEWPQGPAQLRSEGPIDPELVAVEIPGVATAIVYAMHPTSMPRAELRISRDWPGQLRDDALLLQGAVGNATWSGADPGRRVQSEAARILAGAETSSAISLACETHLLALPRAQASRRVPFLLRRAASNLFALALDRFAVQTRLRIGPISLIGVPGEAVGELGRRARPEVLVSFADGYIGYVETPERWQRGEGESSKTYFGPDLARALGLR